MVVCNENTLMDISRMKKIYGVVVLYNPESSVIDNVLSYNRELNALYIIDNSDVKNNKIVEKIKKLENCIYIDNHGNKGIAHALNVGAKLAIKNGAKWLLTMDQDSTAAPNMLDNMLDYLVHAPNIDNISIVAPFHSNPYHTEYISNEPYSEVLTTMTSGNLLNLKTYKEIGPFREELFIDYIDNEYCLRSKLKGCNVIQVNNAILKHNLGELKQHKVLWKRFYSTNHSPIRRYYAFRNRIYIIKTYKYYFPKYCNFEKSRFMVDFVIVILYEKQKLQKLKMMFFGIRDGLRNKYGKFNG